MTCDKITQMHRLHDGDVSPGERAVLEAHAASCPECARELDELRGITRLVAGVLTAPLPDGLVDRLAARVPRSEDRVIFRLASCLTAAAAAILLAVVLTWPVDRSEGIPQPAVWQSLAVRTSAETYSGDTDMIVLAQWMADDLASTHNGELR